MKIYCCKKFKYMFYKRELFISVKFDLCMASNHFKFVVHIENYAKKRLLEQNSVCTLYNMCTVLCTHHLVLNQPCFNGPS